MRCLLKFFGSSVACVGILSFVGNVYAAARVASDSASRSGALRVQRMPSMPVMPINVGNVVTDIDTISVDVPDAPLPPAPEPEPEPEPKPEPEPEPEPEPKPECPDGGVRDSDYTVARCMNDVYMCVNGGALPNGINDLFNEDMRHAVENGMGLCSVQVEKCIRDVRRNCKNVYRVSADVWIDFNSRKVMPDYYAFVLRKTGLTPNQAENTCLLLDRNTYGNSFTGVNGTKTVSEYDLRVGAYNSARDDSLIKKNPQGVVVNGMNDATTQTKGNLVIKNLTASGVGRGHYARWDATTADCLIRVAAYNKDKHIKNSWLFGAVGDDRLAEAWQPAGGSFKCNKDLFGFSLMKDTNTAAVVGIGGGTLLGAGIGAMAGHGDRAMDCEDAGRRREIYRKLQDNNLISVLKQYIPGIKTNGDELSVGQCRALVDLYSRYNAVEEAARKCSYDVNEIKKMSKCDVAIELDNDPYSAKIGEETVEANNAKAFFTDLIEKLNAVNNEACRDVAKKIEELCKEDDEWKKPSDCLDGVNLNLSSASEAATESVSEPGCLFKSFIKSGGGYICDVSDEDCLSASDMKLRAQLNELQGIFAVIGDLLRGEKSNRLKTTLTGAGIGAGVGGVATAITALVEHDNINCRVGDGLARVGFGKVHSIGTLKDFYVKWNLKLPDTVAPTANVVNCETWRDTCADFTDENLCKSAQFIYRPTPESPSMLVHSACVPAGGTCIENYSVARSYGACE